MQLAANLTISVPDILRDVGAAQAAERGQVHVISVAAIKDAVGERWTRHQHLVEDFVLRAFRRAGREDDFIVRVNEADFILIQPGRSATSALSRASQLMRETLGFFLGAVNAEDIRIAIVDRLQGDGLQATSVTSDQLDQAMAERSPHLLDNRDGSAPWERFGGHSAVRKATLIEQANASDLRVLFYLDPVWNLRQGAVAAFRIRSVVMQEAADGELSPAEPDALRPKYQLELALRQLEFAERGNPGPPPALHLAVPLSCLTVASNRTAFISRLASSKDNTFQRLLILELGAISDGLPTMPLQGLVSQLNAFVRGVLALTTGSADIRRWRDEGLCGAVWQAPGGGPEGAKQRSDFVAAAREARLAAACYEIATYSQSIQAWAAGFSHLSGELISRTFGDPVVPQRFSARELYCA